MRKPASPLVRLSSVPRCLRHLGRRAPLDDASRLAAFLRLSAADMLDPLGNGQPDEDALMGFLLCFDLLRDKLDIASGELPFPTCGMREEEDLPPLVRLEGDHE